MGRIVDLLVPATDNAYASAVQKYVAPYVAAFGREGTALRPRSWTEGPGTGDAALALFAWGYHERAVEWETIIAGWPAHCPLFNPPALIAWNTHKTYLRALEAAGVPIVPSRFGNADAASVAGAFDAFGCDELVVKPQVSAGSFRTVRVRRGEPVEPLADAIIQPFLPAVAGEGELSLFAIGGTFSHAARKVATGGDFRIQPQFGGAFSGYEPDGEAMAVFDAVLTALPSAPLYARIDMLRRGDGRLALIEVEAIEPDLYTDLEPAVPRRLAAALARAMGWCA